jgi:hypothetical protein
MTKKADKKPEPADKLFVLGLDGGKPRGARFAERTDMAVKAALSMGLSCICPASAAFTELAAKLPRGRVYASGKAFVPNVRRDLYDKLAAIAEAPSDDSVVHRAESSATTGASSRVACVSPALPGLPRGWDSVGIGHMVLVHESPSDGWWEAVVVSRDDEILTLKFRDYPKQPTFVRHISTIALVNPGPAEPQVAV